MKKFIITASLILMQSCSMFQYIQVQQADSRGSHRCKPVLTTEFNYKVFFTMSKDEANEWGKSQGYSDCSVKKMTEKSRIYECKKPELYSAIFTKSLSECHAFMNKHNIK